MLITVKGLRYKNYLLDEDGRLFRVSGYFHSESSYPGFYTIYYDKDFKIYMISRYLKFDTTVKLEDVMSRIKSL